MAREEGTYIMVVDVFNGQDTLLFPLSHHDGKAYLWEFEIHIDKEPAWNLEDLYIKTYNGQSPVPYTF